MSDTRTEAFIELYGSDTGYNLRHYRQGPPDNDPHVTGEGCACKPERIAQEDTPVTGDVVGTVEER